MTTRLTTIIEGWIEERLPTYAQGDPVTWDMALLPGPSGSPGLYITLFMPGAILGTTIHTMAVLENPGAMVPSDADSFLPKMVENLREERSRTLAEITTASNGTGPEAHGHEHQS